MLERPLIASIVVFGVLSVSCGGAAPQAVVVTPASGVATPSSAPAGAAAAAGATTPAVAGGPAQPAPVATPAPPPPPEHPFAATSLDATNMIDAAIDSRASALVKCVETARPKRKNPHAKILVEVGLDQEGHLLGVKAPAGAPADPDLYACAQAALQGANFPRSHAGIITVVKTFEEQAVYK
jgi:hypothetical protein